MSLVADVSLLTGIVVSLSVAYGTARNYPNPGSVPLTAFLAALGVWAALHLGSHHGPEAVAPILERFQWLGIAPLGVLWFAFAVDYTGNRHRLPRPALAILAALPVVLFLAIWTIPGVWRGLDAESGVVFTGFLLATYGLIIVGSLLLLHHALLVGRPFRDQIVSLLVGITILLVASAVSVLEVFGDLHLHAMPTGLVLAGIALSWAVYRTGVTDLTPVTARSILETIPGGVVVVDAEDRVTHVTDRAADLLGVEGSTRVIGAPVSALAATSDRLRDDAPLRHDDVGSEVVTFEGDDLIIEVRTTGLESLPGDRHVVHLQDVTQREEHRRVLAQQNERLNELTEIISHDLRNPLNVASGRLELAREDCASDHLAEIGVAHDRMSTLIDDLLAMARDGNTGIDPRPVDLASIARECRQTVETDGATIEIEADMVIDADENRLRSLLENLIRNAVDHGGDGVTIRIGELDGAGFYVEDDGSGLPAENREDLFETGFTTSPGGTGLGLSIVREAAEAHGWEIEASDAPGGGARFEVTGVGEPGA